MSEPTDVNSGCAPNPGDTGMTEGHFGVILLTYVSDLDVDRVPNSYRGEVTWRHTLSCRMNVPSSLSPPAAITEMATGS